MTIVIEQQRLILSYNGVELADVPGMTIDELRLMHAATYPELLSCNIEPGAIVNGAQEYEFRKAVCDKGATRPPLADLRAAVDRLVAGEDIPVPLAGLDRVGLAERQRCGSAWLALFDGGDARAERTPLPSSMLAPLA
jgi:PRTRC genetic system protein C